MNTGYAEFESLVRIMSDHFDGMTAARFSVSAHRVVFEYVRDAMDLEGRLPILPLLLVIAQTDASLAHDDLLRAEVIGTIEQIGFRLQHPGGEIAQ
jgi:hypothetical protein